ncbi:hypothetical protein ACM66B_004405 [Microbotryomycetes sp. NB124-2]
MADEPEQDIPSIQETQEHGADRQAPGDTEDSTFGQHFSLYGEAATLCNSTSTFSKQHDVPAPIVGRRDETSSADHLIEQTDLRERFSFIGETQRDIGVHVAQAQAHEQIYHSDNWYSWLRAVPTELTRLADEWLRWEMISKDDGSEEDALFDDSWGDEVKVLQDEEIVEKLSKVLDSANLVKSDDDLKAKWSV